MTGAVVSDNGYTAETEAKATGEFKNGREAANLDKVVVAVDMLFGEYSQRLVTTKAELLALPQCTVRESPPRRISYGGNPTTGTLRCPELPSGDDCPDPVRIGHANAAYA
jgi:hypothetical protein